MGVILVLRVRRSSETDGPHGRTIWYVESQLFVPLTERRAASASNNLSPNGDTNARDEFGDSAGKTDHTNLEDTLHDGSWKQALGSFISSDKFQKLANTVSYERNHQTIYPPPDDTFSALNTCSFDSVRVVIVGQDPYHGPGQGHGLAFSVKKGVKIPPSLKNIYKEAVADVNIRDPTHGNLDCWSEQGVLLLNTVLTVQKGVANSHKGIGWEEFTDEIIEVLNREKKGLVFLLWGKQAEKKGQGINQEMHTVITTSHPSPLGATKTNAPFLGSNCFSRCNDALISQDFNPIDWNVH